MRIIVMFDLPVGTAGQRREATRFRNFLLRDGYSMMQFSVYVRICNGADAVMKHKTRLEGEVPQNGSVRMLVVTERQYAAMDILLGEFVPADLPSASAQISFF